MFKRNLGELFKKIHDFFLARNRSSKIAEPNKSFIGKIKGILTLLFANSFKDISTFWFVRKVVTIILALGAGFALMASVTVYYSGKTLEVVGRDLVTLPPAASNEATFPSAGKTSDNPDKSAVPVATDAATATPGIVSEAPMLPRLPEKPKSNYIVTVAATEESAISRANVAKMLAFLGADAQQISSMRRFLNYTDATPENWYGKYVNAVLTLGFMTNIGDDFMPEKPLTVHEAQQICDKINTKNKIIINITNDNKDKPIAHDSWVDLYGKLLLDLGKDDAAYKSRVERANIIVLATSKNNKSLKASEIITDIGPLSFEGLAMDNYVDKQVYVYKKDSEIIAVARVVSEAPTIKYAYVIYQGNDRVRLFSGGVERTYLCDSTIGTKAPSGSICDITISGGKAIKLEKLQDRSTGEVKRLTDFLELSDKSMPLAPGVRVYSVADGFLEWKAKEDVAVGAIVDVYEREDNVVVISERASESSEIRVAISTSGFGGLIHRSIKLTSDTIYSVRWGEEEDQRMTLDAGEVFYLDTSCDFYQQVFTDGVESIFIEPQPAPEIPAGKIELVSVKRNWPDGENPKYRGTFEIKREGSGFVIINELTMNEYLYAVVPSEMPSTYGVEAAKVQAVAARSFAYAKSVSGKYNDYGANIDDTTKTQVYNNQPESEVSIQAVDETDGEILLSGSGDIIPAYYFATSCGMTSNVGEAWSVGIDFPGASPSYNRAVKQYYDADYGDLTIEENAYAFLKDLNVPAYDNGSPWFRWNVEMTAEEVSDTVNDRLGSLYDNNHRMVLTFVEGEYKSVPVGSIGAIKDMNVIRRGEGCNIILLEIIGSDATVIVAGEQNMRSLFKPGVINRKDGSTISSFSSFPSASFVLDKVFDENGELVSILFTGGGWGHGIGMSQDGVSGMVKAGHNYKEILNHFYGGSEVQKIM